MLEELWKVGAYILRHTGDFSRTQWTIILVVALIVGIVCTRGHSARASY